MIFASSSFWSIICITPIVRARKIDIMHAYEWAPAMDAAYGPFLTAGVWMGSFWAQEAWANYWGWDSKENSALITWLVYVAYIHLRMLGGYRGAKAMSVLVGGAAAVFMTFQLFGYLPDSQKSLHRYTDDGVTPQEGQVGPAPTSNEQARASTPTGNSADDERR